MNSAGAQFHRVSSTVTPGASAAASLLGSVSSTRCRDPSDTASKTRSLLASITEEIHNSSEARQEGVQQQAEGEVLDHRPFDGRTNVLLVVDGVLLGSNFGVHRENVLFL